MLSSQRESRVILKKEKKNKEAKKTKLKCNSNLFNNLNNKTIRVTPYQDSIVPYPNAKSRIFSQLSMTEKQDNVLWI